MPSNPSKVTTICRFPPNTSEFGLIHVKTGARFKRPLIPRSQRVHALMCTTRQLASRLIKGVSMSINCVRVPECPSKVADPSAGGLPLFKVKGDLAAARLQARCNTDQL